MLDFTVYHEAKSKYAYMYDKDTVHLRLFAKKDKVKKIEVIYGDPFLWVPVGNSLDEWTQVRETKDSDMSLEYQTELYDHFFIALKPQYKRMKYAFIINDQYLYGCREIVDIAKYPEAKKNLFNHFNFPYLNEEDVFSAPPWVEDQIWYSIFPERFNNGDSSIDPEGTLPWGKTNKYSNSLHFGGDLQGIIDKLKYIKSVGFTGIYMTPIFEADATHKYDTVDYYKIDKDFGDNKLFGKLVEEAHKLGIKVMLDAVFNHSGFRHPYFLDVVKNGKKSKYYDCFYILDDTLPIVSFEVNPDFTINRENVRHIYRDPSLLNYRAFGFTPYMPKLNTNNPIMKEYLLDVAKFWIEKYDIDGWRLDVSNEVSHKFWRDFRTTVKKAKKETYIVGENWDNSNPWLQGDQYDGVMNYEILIPIWNYFGTNINNPEYSSTEFMYKINKVLTDYPKNVLKSMYNLVDSHDTSRILDICSNNINLVKLPYLFLFAFPGAPSIFYGGEIGLEGKHDPDNRRCMIWEKDKQNQDILSHIKKLIRLRNKYRAFKSTEFEWIEVNDKFEFIIFKKGNLYFLMSKRYIPHSIILPKELQHTTVKDIYNDKTVDLSTTIEIGSYGFFIFKK